MVLGTPTPGGPRVFSEFEENGLIETTHVDDLDPVREIAQRKRQKGRQTQEIFKSKEKDLDEREIAERVGITIERAAHRLKRF